MTGSESVDAVSRIADDFYKSRNRSELDLFEASGYLEHRKLVTEDALRKLFEQHPELVDMWIRLSEDSRSSGPYLATRDNHWEVGQFPRGSVAYFPDRASACARFVTLKMAGMEEVHDRIRKQPLKHAIMMQIAKHPTWIPRWLFWKLFVTRGRR